MVKQNEGSGECKSLGVLHGQSVTQEVPVLVRLALNFAECVTESNGYCYSNNQPCTSFTSLIVSFDGTDSKISVQ